jgi:hypothetical protein
MLLFIVIITQPTDTESQIDSGDLDTLKTDLTDYKTIE